MSEGSRLNSDHWHYVIEQAFPSEGMVLKALTQNTDVHLQDSWAFAAL